MQVASFCVDEYGHALFEPETVVIAPPADTQCGRELELLALTHAAPVVLVMPGDPPGSGM
jgi:hypothetical protein